MEKLTIAVIAFVLTSVCLASLDVRDDVAADSEMIVSNKREWDQSGVKTMGDYFAKKMQRLAFLEELIKDLDDDADRDFDPRENAFIRTTKGKPKRKTFFVGK